MRNGCLLIVALALVAAPFPAWGEDLALDYTQTFAAGKINWGGGKIAATGFSLPPKKTAGGQAAAADALSAARQKAVETLAGLTGDLRLSGGQTIADTMAKTPSIAEKIDEMVRAAPVVQQNFRSDGAAEIVIELSLYGGFAQLILPEDIRHFEAIQSVQADQENSPAGVKANAGRAPFGGLIIDARGLGVNPAMMFAVLDENGKPVYGSAYVSREYAVQWGMAAYVTRIPAGKAFPRVTPMPLVIKGLRAVGVARTDIVISNADAAKLKGAVENLILLRQGRVAVVLD